MRNGRDKMRIIFMGTPEFAVPSLEKIISDGNEVTAVFTQPDKPKGRGYRVTPSPVKVAALKHGIEVFQPTTLKDEKVISIIRELNPDCIVVVAYGRILPQTVLAIPKYGCVNVHASLLPRYRGAAPIQWSVINGEEETGVTTMFMARGIDTGDMILKGKTRIGENETYGELHNRLMEIGAQTLSKTLELLKDGKAPREKQNDGQSNYAPMIDKNVAKIDWIKSAKGIHNLVRGLSPAPAAFTEFNGKMLKIYESRLTGETSDAKAGVITVSGKDGIHVCCGDGKVVLITSVQAQGGKRMSAADFARGHGIKTGTVFGE